MIDFVRAVSEKRNPVPIRDGWIVELGKAAAAAIKAGYVCVYHGWDDDWGGYKVTPAGLAILKEKQ